MKNRYTILLQNTMLISVGTLASKMLMFLMVRFYTGVLTQAEYGTADLIMQTANLLIPVISLGAADGVFRFALDGSRQRKNVFSAGASLIIGGSLVLIVITMIALHFNLLPESMWMIVPYSVFSCVHSLCSQYIRANGKTALYAGQGILNTVLVIGWNILFLVVFHFGIGGYVMSVVFADACCTVYLIIKAQLWREITFSPGRKIFMQMLRYSLPLIPTTIFWWITSVSDRYMIMAFLGRDANGLYAVANKIPTMLTLVSGMFLEAWQFSAVTESSGSKDEHIHFYSMVWNSFQGVMMVAGSVVIACSKILIHLLAAESYYSAWMFVPNLSIAMIFSSYVTFMGSVYMVQKKSILSFWTAMAGAGINLLLNFLLIPEFGLQGAAVATMVSYLVSMLLRMKNARSMLPFKLHGGKLLFGVSVISIQTVALLKENSLAAPIQVICLMMLLLAYRKSFIAIMKKLNDIKNEGKR